MTYFVLISKTAPNARLSVFESIDGAGVYATVKPGFKHQVIPVQSQTDLNEVPLCAETRFLAWLKQAPEKGYEVLQEGLIGSVDFSCGPEDMRVFGADGKVSYSGDASECPDVFPPEFFGLKGFEWWLVNK